MQTWGEPEDVGQVVAFLCSEKGRLGACMYVYVCASMLPIIVCACVCMYVQYIYIYIYIYIYDDHTRAYMCQVHDGCETPIKLLPKHVCIFAC
jgi:hypothetical protein